VRPPLKLPILLARLRQIWHWRFFRPAVPANEALIERIAYGNLRAAMPERPRSWLRRQARNSRRAVRRTLFEIENPFLWPGSAVEGLDHLRSATSAGQGALVTSFHVGPYRFLPLVLSLHGFSVDLVVDRRGTGRERAFLDDMRQGLDRQGHWRRDLRRRLGEIDVINAQEADVGLRMFRALRKGHVVFVMLDGNTGAGARKSERLHHVPFFGTQIQVRVGAGEIAHAADAPVVLALCWRRLLGPDTYRLYSPCARRPGESRADFSGRLVQELVAELEARLRPDPSQWEEWFHLHQMQETRTAAREPSRAAPRKSGRGGRWAADSYRAFAVSDGQAHFVFEPEQRRFVTVTGLSVQLLQALYQPRSTSELLALLEPAQDPQAVMMEMEQLRSRGWVEAHP